MKRTVILLAGSLCLAATVATLAQPPRPAGPGRPGGLEGPGGPGVRGFRLPPSPVMIALDTDGDGELSAKEIENAPAALKTLDKDKNGKLTENELRPNFGGPGGPEMRTGGAFSGEAIITQLMAFDKNGDGKLSKEEIPQRLQKLLDRGDTNKDNILDRAELLVLSRQRIIMGPGGLNESNRPEPPKEKEKEDR